MASRFTASYRAFKRQRYEQRQFRKAVSIALLAAVAVALVAKACGAFWALVAVALIASLWTWPKEW